MRFENLVVSEALKARYNNGAEPNLYFFRNSKGLEIDIILKENKILNLFEVKSGKALNDEFTKNMEKFCSKYSSNVSTDSDDGVKGTVIYSGDTVPSYKDYAYINFHQIAEQFVPKEKPFVLEF